MEKPELYWQRRISLLEDRVEKLEAMMAANRVSIANRSEYYSIKEFAAAMSVCDTTIYRKVMSGEINAVKVGKTWRIPRAELDRVFTLV